MEDLLYQIRSEFTVGDDYMKPKRDQILKRLTKHIKQNKEPGLMNINMVSNTIDTLIAGSYIDEPQVKFVSRDMFLENEQADNLNYMFKFDTKEMDYQQLDYQVQRDRYFFGLGIKYKHGFDTTKKCPIFYAVNPMTAIFDPTPTLIGNFTANQYKYFGFRMTASMRELKNDPQYNKAELSKLTKQSIDNDTELMKQALSISDNTNYVCDNLLLNFSVEIYHHFTIYNGEKILVTTDSERKIILRQEAIAPVLEEEKKDKKQIGRPFAFYFYKPERGKVLGVSVPDLLDDKEEAKTILLNASLIKARVEAMGGRFIVNSRYFNNPADILKPTSGTQYLFTNDKIQAGEPLTNVMQELPTSQVKQDVMTMSNIIEREGIMDTKQDQMQMGIVPDKTMTKAEQQSVQGNANMLNSLNLKTYLWGEYEFAFLRWRTYQEYFSVSDEKFILMNQDFEWTSKPIKRDGFKTKNNPFIITGSKSDIEAMTEKQKQFWRMMLPMIMNDPDVPKISKMIAKRFSAKLEGMPTNVINQIYGLLPSERQSKDRVENFINDNVVPKTIFKNPNFDYYCLWIYLQKAEATEARDKVMKVVEQYLIDQGMEIQSPGTNEQANTASNIMMGQASQNMGNEILSKQTVLPNNPM